MTTSASNARRAIAALLSLIATQSDFTAAGGTRPNIMSCLEDNKIEKSMPTTSTWEVDIEAWNSRLTPMPTVVVFPKTEAEVSAALLCAAGAGVKVTTLGGNRSFSSKGFGRDDGALVMNMKHFEHLKFDATTNLLSFGGPVMTSQAVKYLWKEAKRTLPHGRCPTVGMTGVAAAGFGTTTRLRGTVLDNVESVRIALANGSIVDADGTSNSDIFWAVRGATSSMGVVLDFKIKTYETLSDRVTNYTIDFEKEYEPTIQDNVDLFLGTQTWATSKDNSDLLSLRFSIRKSSDIRGFFYGSSADAEKTLASLMKYLPKTVKLEMQDNDFWDSEEITTPGLTLDTPAPRRYFYITSVTIPNDKPLKNDTAYSLFSNTAFASKLEDVTTSGFIDIWGGSYTKTIKPDTTAWKHDNNLLLIRWDMRSTAANVSFADSSVTTTRENFYKFVKVYKDSGGLPGGFLTYIDDLLSIVEVAYYMFFGNFKRLQAIKTKYDPNMLFNSDPQAIPALSVS
ncbi:hypothetical protein CCR75_003738 [Bremia lactucae]|uniref:FAD-binding PCMH-type domain-containing protein n=1 Tax=Bremia lactucae TaxID=4779 RepID=A0A976FLB0_BRELC|nr:hypothetical protein CCR75_003738 [Bremia lactucae]